MREIMGESLARARWVIWLALRLPLYTHVLGWRRRRRIRPPLTSHLFFPPSAEVGIVSLVGGHGMCWQTTSTSAKSCSSNTAETSNTSLLLLLLLLLLLSIQDTPSHLCALFPPLQDHLTPSFLSSSLRVAAREESVVESVEDSPITKEGTVTTQHNLNY